MNKYGDLLYADPPPVPPGYRVLTPAERAKIFKPFDALRGFDLALSDKHAFTRSSAISPRMPGRLLRNASSNCTR